MYSNTFAKSKQCSPTIKEGDIFPSNSYGDFKIIGYSSSRNIKVQFLETNEIGYTSSSSIKKGQVRPYEPDN